MKTKISLVGGCFFAMCMTQTLAASNLDKLINSVEKGLHEIKKYSQEHPETGEKIDALIAIAKEETNGALAGIDAMTKHVNSAALKQDLNTAAMVANDDAEMLLQEAGKLLDFHADRFEMILNKHLGKRTSDRIVALCEKTMDNIEGAIKSSNIEANLLQACESLKTIFPKNIRVDYAETVPGKVHIKID